MTAEKKDADLAARADAAVERLAEARASIAKSIVGLDSVVEQSLAVLLSGGHGLLVGAPGLAKTRLVHTLALVAGLDDKRVQFTPDLMPADIVGSDGAGRKDEAGGAASASFPGGPVFCQLLMADEINRASPRTQAALLQAMQERFVTVAGQRHDLPEAFPRSGHPEPDRAGRHLSPARSPARPLPDADRRALSRPRGRARHPAGHDGV